MRVIRISLTIAIPLAIFTFITFCVINHSTNSFDHFIYSNVASFITPKFTNFMKVVTFFGSGEFLTTAAFVLFILIYVLYKKEKSTFQASMLVLNLTLSAILNTGIKYIIHRDRPNILRLIQIDGLSYPSGHSMISMCFYGLIIYLVITYFKPRAKYIIIPVLALLILTIGLSRIYLGVHYASDVLGGFTLGLTWVGLYTLIIERFKPERY